MKQLLSLKKINYFLPTIWENQIGRIDRKTLENTRYESVKNKDWIKMADALMEKPVRRNID